MSLNEDELRNILLNTGKNFWGRKLTPEQKEYLEQKYSGYSFPIQCRLFINNEKRPECPICGGALKLLRNTTCSYECAKILDKKTGKIQERTKKAKQTNLERYGVENPQQCEKIKEKTAKTNIKKYGYKCSLQNETIKQKTKNTNLKKYGVEYGFQSEEVKKKIKQTNLERYGFENISLLPNHREKCKNTLIKNYGVDHYQKSDEFKEKRKLKNIERFQSTLPDNIEILDLNDPDLDLKNKFNHPNKRIKFYCHLHENEEIIPIETFKFRHRIYSTCCSHCANIFPTSSSKEKELVEFLKSFCNEEIIENDRKILYPKELDIVLPEMNIAIEFCGLFWHNEDRVGKNYHYDKMRKCKKNGYKLITIFEDEWDYKNEIVKNILKAKIVNKNIKNYFIKEISNESSIFFNKKYNINNEIFPATLNYGIFIDSNLISVMSFNHTYEKQYELINYSSSIDCNYDKNFKDLLNYFVKINNPEKIYFCVDNRWDIIENFDFKECNEFDIGYWYINGNKRLNPNIEKNNNYRIIWDCGKTQYIWTKKERE